jgi:hypothetical protein
MMLSHPHPKDEVLRDLLISVDIWEKMNEEMKNPKTWTRFLNRIPGEDV